MTREDRGEWAKVFIGLFAGALMLFYAEFLWLAHHNVFCTPREEAEARRYWAQVYDCIAVNPFDEMGPTNTIHD